MRIFSDSYSCLQKNHPFKDCFSDPVRCELIMRILQTDELNVP
jgi:hypothetical protein